MSIHDAASMAAQAEIQEEPPSDRWSVDLQTSKIDDSTNVFVTTPAIKPVQGRFRRETTPYLMLRCMENRTSAYFTFNGLHMADIQGYGDVTVRIDKRKADTHHMSASTDSEALGLWSGGRAIPFIKSLFGGENLIVRVTPYSDSPRTVEFKIAGLEEAIAPLRKACNW